MNKLDALLMAIGIVLAGTLISIAYNLNQGNAITGNLVSCDAAKSIACSTEKTICCNGYKYCNICDRGYTLDPKDCETCIRAIGIINAYSDPSEADVYVDNVNKGKTPLVIGNVGVGRHTVKLEKAGYVESSKSIYVDAGEIITVNSNLVGVGIGSARIMTSPNGAAVYVDGDYKGLTTVLVENINPGRHSIRIEKEGYAEYNSVIYIEKDKETKLSITLEN
ncbi:PEGA domain-containing protein [Candidatus Woesearchaeota archaeon]|nr:PEGA domain-containing protein [Candidatus Woesearchaeota archaeon]